METTYDCYIEQIVQNIFSAMLGIEVARAFEAPQTFAEKFMATIQIAGEKSMSVVLSVCPGVARQATASMLQMPPADVSNEDERDVVAELANMIGGNLKSLLPGPLFLSLPAVVEGRNLGLEVPGAELVEDVVLQCENGLLRVRLYAQIAA